jgi:hypothetical protein
MENIKALLDVLSKVGVCETGKRYLNGTAKDINVLYCINIQIICYICGEYSYTNTTLSYGYRI